MSATNGDSGRYLSPEEAGERYGFRPEHLRRLARAGLCPSIKIQHLIRFDTVDMDAWIDQHRREASAR